MSEELVAYHEEDSRLTEEELRKRLASYKDAAITDELYSFGKMMVEKSVERFKGLDSKATSIAAYSIGIITLLASTQASWIKPFEVWSIFLVFSAVAAFVSAWFAVSALHLRKTDWFSQDEWVKVDGSTTAEILRRFHLINMWGVLSSHQRASDTKAARIALAEGSLIASALLLILSLVLALVVGLPLGFGVALR